MAPSSPESLLNQVGLKYLVVSPVEESYTHPGGNDRMTSHSSERALSSEAKKMVSGREEW